MNRINESRLAELGGGRRGVDDGEQRVRRRESRRANIIGVAHHRRTARRTRTQYDDARQERYNLDDESDDEPPNHMGVWRESLNDVASIGASDTVTRMSSSRRVRVQ